MPVFKFDERPESRHSTANPPTLTLEYCAAGETDEQYVQAYARAATPSIASSDYGLLYRQDVQLRSIGWNIFNVSVLYGQNPNEIDTGGYSLSFSTLGGTINVKAALENGTIYTTVGSTPKTTRAIGEEGDSILGAEVVIPALHLVADFHHPLGVITLSQIKYLARQTGKVNSSNFLTFDAGEVLFLGCEGREGVGVETTVAYHFACEENLQNKVIEGITVLRKDGWDHLSCRFNPGQKTVDGKVKPTIIIDEIHVDRVYERVNLAMVLGFGG